MTSARAWCPDRFPHGGERPHAAGVAGTPISNGRGSIRDRGRWPNRRRSSRAKLAPPPRLPLVITELHLSAQQGGLDREAADQVNDGKIGGIADIRDESDRDGMRVVVEVRATAIRKGAGRAAAHAPPCQSNFGADSCAPCWTANRGQLSPCARLLQHFLEFGAHDHSPHPPTPLKRNRRPLEVVEGLHPGAGFPA